jgi:NTP pyrophosphatase (non-canonical NTP hydrolase)
MHTIKDLTNKIIAFRDARNWKQFHTPKDLSISLVLEAGEVMEHFQWKTKEEVEEHIRTHKEDISDELADVFSYLLIMCNELDINISDALESKLKKSAQNYPVEKSRGKSTKYTELETTGQ